MMYVWTAISVYTWWPVVIAVYTQENIKTTKPKETGMTRGWLPQTAGLPIPVGGRDAAAVPLFWLKMNTDMDESMMACFFWFTVYISWCVWWWWCVCLCVCLRVSVRPFTGKYLDNKMKGSYSCVVCGAGLFSSSDKFESGCGWPAFSQVLSSAAVSLTADHSHGLSVCRLQLIISN